MVEGTVLCCLKDGASWRRRRDRLLQIGNRLGAQLEEMTEFLKAMGMEPVCWKAASDMRDIDWLNAVLLSLGTGSQVPSNQMGTVTV